MAEQVGDAFVRLSVRDDNFNKGLSGAQKKVGKLGGLLSGLGGKIAVAFGGAALARGAFSAFAEQEKAVAKLGAVIKATGGAAGFTSKEMQEMASELQQVTTFGDESVISMQTVLATFKNVKGDEFKRASAAILDMSSVLDQDAKQGAIQLGKALNDPIKGVAALNRVGVQFTESQKKQIKTLQESGDIMGAQGVILKELEGQFGGAAEAAANTVPGALTQMGNAFGDLGENIVGALTGGNFIDAIKAVTNGIVKIGEGVKFLGTVITPVADALRDSFGAALSNVFDLMGSGAGAVGDLAKLIVGVLGTSVIQVSGVLEKMSVVLRDLFTGEFKKIPDDMEKINAKIESRVQSLSDALTGITKEGEDAQTSAVQAAVASRNAAQKRGVLGLADLAKQAQELALKDSTKEGGLAEANKIAQQQVAEQKQTNENLEKIIKKQDPSIVQGQ